MAKVVDKFSGSFSGQLGDLVYRRYKDGSVFVARQKSVNTVSYSDKCVKTRNNFKVAVAFAKASNLLPDIHAIWKNSVYKGRSPYTKILKANIGLVKDKILPGLRSKLTPDGFGLDFELSFMSKDKISLSLSLPLFSKSYVNTKFILNFVIALHNPKNTGSESEFKCISDSSEIVFPDYDNFHTLETNFSSMNRDVIQDFQNAIIFFALTNTENTKHIFSGTFHSEAGISD